MTSGVKSAETPFLNVDFIDSHSDEKKRKGIEHNIETQLGEIQK